MLNGSVGKELLVHCWWEVKGYKPFGKEQSGLQRNQYAPAMGPAVLTPSQKTASQVGVQVHASNPSAQEAETGRCPNCTAARIA